MSMVRGSLPRPSEVGRQWKNKRAQQGLPWRLLTGWSAVTIEETKQV